MTRRDADRACGGKIGCPCARASVIALGASSLISSRGMDFASRLQNVSWANVAVDAVLDRHGRDVALVVAKVAYKVSLQGAARRVIAPLRRMDEGDEGGGVLFPADLDAPEKPGTDVGLVG